MDKFFDNEELSKSKDWAGNLVGQVEQELLIPTEIISKCIS